MARQRKSEFTVYCIKIIWDVLLIVSSLYLSFWLRFYSDFFDSPRGIPTLSAYSIYFPIIGLLFIIIFHNFGMYSKQLLSYQSLGLINLWKAVTFSVFALMALNFAIKADQEFSRIMLFLFWLNCIVILSIGRAMLRWFEFNYMHRWHKKIRVLIIGSGLISKRLIVSSKRYLHLRKVVVGIIEKDDALLPKTKAGVPILGYLKDFKKILEQHHITEVILTLKDISHDEIVQLILECEKRLISFKMIPDMYEILTSQVDVESIDGIPLLGLKDFPLEKVFNRIQKRILDIVGSLIGIILFSPLFLIISILIKISSKGPIFYKQERVGENGKKFNMYKFRTMKENAEKETGPVWAKLDDDRKTKIGKILRSFNLDELPQLWNVYCGDMSLVGPRPERPNFVEEFKKGVPRYMSRHQIKSGMTGWAQVNGLRGNTSIDERIKYDIYYLENWSVLLDIKIILMTFLTWENAY